MAMKEVGEQKSENLSEEIVYKIEIPANRYDLLSIEGLSRALRIFLGKESVPTYLIASPPSGAPHKLIIKPNTAKVRRFMVAAVLRNMKFTQESYNSFIDLQDKLHGNICRKRTLVSMGTHDLDTIVGPFYYDAQPPSDIKFVPLNQSVEMSGPELMTHYESDIKLKKYLHIIRDSPLYPVVHDSNNVVMSLPPIINSNHSKITLHTKNVFIDVTATDLTKAQVVLNTLVAAFSQYCELKFSVEQVEVSYPDGTTLLTPDVSERQETVSLDYIRKSIGVNPSGSEIVSLLNRMSLKSKLSMDGKNAIVSVPISRSDIFHACDIMEDVAIAYGFNNIPRTIPKTYTVGGEFGINKLSDHLRLEVAMAGFSEVLTLTLCSKAENFDFLNKIDDSSAVVLSNPKTIEYEVARTSLLPGVLKTVCCNRKSPLPLKLFEISDVVFLDASADVGARNERHLCAINTDMTSGFEVVHGLLDRLMKKLGVEKGDNGYSTVASADPTFFPGRCADVLFKGKKIGSFGIIHPDVLKNFNVDFVSSALEINIEPFL